MNNKVMKFNEISILLLMIILFVTLSGCQSRDDPYAMGDFSYSISFSRNNTEEMTIIIPLPIYKTNQSVVKVVIDHFFNSDTNNVTHYEVVETEYGTGLRIDTRGRLVILNSRISIEWYDEFLGVIPPVHPSMPDFTNSSSDATFCNSFWFYSSYNISHGHVTISTLNHNDRYSYSASPINLSIGWQSIKMDEEIKTH